MAESVWEKGRLRAVYHPVGRRENGEARYRRANYDVLSWVAPGAVNEALYVVPLGIKDAVSGAEVNLKNDDQSGHEFGYYDIECHIVEAHQNDGLGDSWRSLHSFGWV